VKKWQDFGLLYKSLNVKSISGVCHNFLDQQTDDKNEWPRKIFETCTQTTDMGNGKIFRPMPIPIIWQMLSMAIVWYTL